jgi:hypothetical protein
VVRAKRPKHLPIVLSRDEVRAVVLELHGTPRLMATLLYGSGLRLLECCRLRVQDVDFAMNQIVVRDGKGAKDRVTVLPTVAKGALTEQLQRMQHQHEADLRRGAGWVELPWALDRKYPNAGREWPWQWAFPATRFYVDRLHTRPQPRSGRRHQSSRPRPRPVTTEPDGQHSVNIPGLGIPRRQEPGVQAKHPSDQAWFALGPMPSTVLPCERRRGIRATQFWGITS